MACDYRGNFAAFALSDCAGVVGGDTVRIAAGMISPVAVLRDARASFDKLRSTLLIRG